MFVVATRVAAGKEMDLAEARKHAEETAQGNPGAEVAIFQKVETFSVGGRATEKASLAAMAAARKLSEALNESVKNVNPLRAFTDPSLVVQITESNIVIMAQALDAFKNS